MHKDIIDFGLHVSLIAHDCSNFIHTAIGFADTREVIQIRHPECVTHTSACICIAIPMTGAGILTNGASNVRYRHSNDVASTPQFIF